MELVNSVVRAVARSLAGIGVSVPVLSRAEAINGVESSASGACWCGDVLKPTRYRSRSFGLLRCDSCGCYRIDPPPIRLNEEGSSFYTAYYTQDRTTCGPTRSAQNNQARARTSRFWRVAAQVPSLGIPRGRVIDVGCGDGRLCYELALAGWHDVIGVDVSASRVRRAQSNYPGIRFYDRHLGKTDVAEGMADLCVLDNVIEHLPQPLPVFHELSRYLRVGGKLVVITPNMESTHFKMLRLRWTPELAPRAHVFLFTAAALARLLRVSGFTIQASGTIHEDPYPLRSWWARLMTGDVKGAIWRAHQELAATCARLGGTGPMLFMVAELANPGAPLRPGASSIQSSGK